MKKQIKATSQVDNDFYKGLEDLFEDFIQNDIMEITSDIRTIGLVDDATERLFEKVCIYMDIPIPD